MHSETLRCGLLGRTLGHSYSPAIHAQLAGYSYLLYEKEPEELEVSLLRADEEEGEPILSAITDTEELEAVYQLMMDQLYEDEEDQES